MKRRIWTTAEFAKHGGVSPIKARRLLLRIHAESGGKLLLPRTGAPRRYEFCLATLRKLRPELFAPVESLEGRLDELEETVTELRADLRRVASQVGSNTRGLARVGRMLVGG